jgi:hypothetical protein
LGHYSGRTAVVAIATAGAFPYEVTRATTDLVTITDLILKRDLVIYHAVGIWLLGGW